MQRHIDGHDRIDKCEPAAQIEHGAQRRRDREAPANKDIGVGQCASVNEYACAGGDTATGWNCYRDRITG